MTVRNLDKAGRKRFAKRIAHLPRAKPTASQRRALEEDEKKIERRITPERRVRVPVDYDFAALNPEVMRRLARIAGYAKQKYGAWDRYTKQPLVGDADPINHAFSHLFDYLMGKSYERFDGGSDWNLIAAIYNLMMAFDAHHRWGPQQHPLVLEVLGAPNGCRTKPFKTDEMIKTVVHGAAMAVTANLMTEALRRRRKRRRKKS